MTFATPNVGYALGEYNDDYSAFYRTEDAGETWTLQYKIYGQTPAFFKTPQENTVILKRYNNSPTGSLHYISRDGGKSWEKLFDNNDHLEDLEDTFGYKDGGFIKMKENMPIPIFKFGQMFGNGAVVAEDGNGKVALLHRSFLLYSEDDGKTWEYKAVSQQRDNVPYPTKSARSPYFRPRASLYFEDENHLLYFSNKHLFRIAL